MYNDEQEHTCCLCKKKFKGWGNNPWPLDDSELTCCNLCNSVLVLPARIDMMYKQRGADNNGYKSKQR